MSDDSNPRGLRLLNPGNLRKSDIKWQGMAAEQPDPAFITFTSSHWGIRALAMVLLSYYRRHGLNSVRGLINRFAPPNENDTPAYVVDVARRCAVKSDAAIKVDDPAMLCRLCAAIIFHEQGQQPFPSVTIANAVDDALGIKDA